MTARRHPGTRSLRRAGVVLPAVLVLVFTVCLVVALVTSFSVRSMRLVRRTLDVQRAFVVAESGLAYGVKRVQAIINNEKIAGIRAKYDTIAAPATPVDAGEYELRVKVVLGDGTDSGGPASTVSSASQYVTVYAGARNRLSGVSCALKQTILAQGTSLGEYGAFYEGDFEANPGNPGQTFTGKVHSNGSMYVTKIANFNRNLTCVGRFLHRRKNTGLDDFNDGGLSINVDKSTGDWSMNYDVVLNGQSRGAYRMATVRFGDDAELGTEEKDRQKKAKKIWDGTRYVDSTLGDAEWVAQSSLYYGNAVQTGDNGVTKLTPPIGAEKDNHYLIEPPKTRWDSDYNAEAESQKLARKAALYLHVDADGNYRLYRGVGSDGFRGEDITHLLKRAVPAIASTNVSSQSYGDVVNPGLNFEDSWTRSKRRTTAHVCTVYDKDTGTTGAYNLANRGSEGQNGGAIQTDNYFVDRRIQWVMKPVDLYLDEILRRNSPLRRILDAAPGGDEGPDKIIYVDVDEPAFVAVGRYDAETGTDRADGGTGRIRPIPCVRIRNGADLQGSDVSIVTARHLYVEGNFNTNGKGARDAASTEDVPSAMLAGDTVTTLSNFWQQHHYDPNFSVCLGVSGDYVWNAAAAKLEIDQTDGAQLSDRVGGGITRIIQSHMEEEQQAPGEASFTDKAGGIHYFRGRASETTVNAVCMLGIIPSIPVEESQDFHQDNNYSGGFENVFRWIEDWKQVKLHFNGTVLCLYDVQEPEYRWRMSSTAEGGFNYDGENLDSYVNFGGNYQYKKKKSSKYHVFPDMPDWSYLRMTPPGLPNFFSARETEWSRVAWSSVWDD